MTELAEGCSFQRNECTLEGGDAVDAAARWYVITEQADLGSAWSAAESLSQMQKDQRWGEIDLPYVSVSVAAKTESRLIISVIEAGMWNGKRQSKTKTM